MSCSTTLTRDEALAERIFHAAIAALELHGIYLGRRLGLYAVLRERGAMAPGELARAAGIDARYAREWLEQQAVAGLLEVDDPAAPAEARRFRLPAEHAHVLLDEDHATYSAALAEMLAGVGGAIEQVVDAYRSGGGVEYARYGAAFRCGQGDVNRPVFGNDLVRRWLPSIADLDARLRAGGARIADVACGTGHSTIALANAYPAADVVGFDLDAASIDDARRHADAAGSRARFARADAVDLAAAGPFDLILVLESLHDMARPTEALAALRKALTPSGSLIVVDERVAERFTAPGDAVERIMYGWSIVHCLPASRCEHPSEALGTVLRADTVKRCAANAGFARCEVLPVEHPIFRVYRLREGEAS
jgi:ubiquinone/menaquinone biosynthesis C-methylase UbiE